jgi:DNA primase
MDAVDEIKDRLDIVEFIGHYVPLKKAGRNYKGLCPFHQENTPSFVVFPETQTWHCFGACGTGGDIFTFVMRQETMEFREALEFLAERAGVVLREPTPQEATANKIKRLLTELNELAADRFHHWLLESEAGRQGRAYLSSRGLVENTIEAFQLGYAPDDWHTLENFLLGKGYQLRDIVSAGLVTQRDDGNHYDRFRGRLMIPIRDIRGQIVGFGGRVLDESLPKYLNSPQTALFDKSSILYGIDRARSAIRDNELAVIVEGYMDVLMAHQHGFKNIVASMGTALTEQQLSILKRLTKRIALALDSDTAGDKGTLRGLETAQEVLDRRWVPVPTWKGFIDYESRLDAELRIITLPSDLDPDEIIRENPDRWRELVESSLPVIDYYFQALTRDLDLEAPKDKTEAVDRLLPVIAESSDPIERAHYVQRLARLVKTDERVLEKKLSERKPLRGPSRGRARRGSRSRFSTPRKAGRFSGFPGMNFGAETYCLFLLLEDPGLFQVMNQVLERIECQPLEASDFQQTRHREMFEVLKSRWQADDPLSVADLDDEDPLWGDLVGEFIDFLEYTSALPEADLTIAAGRCALQLRRMALDRRLVELRYLGEDKDNQDLQQLKEWMVLISQHTREKQRIDAAMNNITVLGYRDF